MKRFVVLCLIAAMAGGVFFSVDPGRKAGIAGVPSALADPGSDPLEELGALLTRKPYKGEEKKVWVELTWVTPEYLKALVASGEGKKALKVYREIDLEKSIAFKVSLTTHTINLREYEVVEKSLLVDDQGTEYRPSGWRELPSPMPMMASHHRMGILRFPKLGKDKSPVIGEKTKAIEVLIRNLGKVEERGFRWTFPLSKGEGSPPPTKF